MTTLPMFPLGTVVFPGAQLPLRVFEPRYLSLFGDLSEADSYFGTCLIEKGHEVGGDDSRFSSGTLCQIIRSEELPSKQLIVQSIGIDRLSVDRWLPDEGTCVCMCAMCYAVCLCDCLSLCSYACALSSAHAFVRV